MSYTLGQLASSVSGELIGDPGLLITDAALVDHAEEEQITFAASEKILKSLDDSHASAALIGPDLSYSRIPVIRVEDPVVAFTQIVRLFRPQPTSAAFGISEHAVIDPSAELAEDVAIQAGATIGPKVKIGAGSVIHSGVHIMAGCQIGKQTTLFPGVTLYENSILGERCLLHANCSIGAFGFGYDMREGHHRLSPQLGNVILGNDVEIGALSSIDRGTFGPTTIGDGTKIDNQVMIAHNCRIGRHNLICSQVGIAGSTTTGDYVVIAGQVGIKDHIRIGSRVTIGAQSGVMRDIASNESYLGTPATPAQDQMKVIAALMNLPELRKQLRQIVREMNSSPPEGSESENRGEDTA